METRQKRSGEISVTHSAGRTGKSATFQALENLGIQRTAVINGRNKDVTRSQFTLSKVTRLTDFIFVDDCHQYVDFDFFYSIITGKTEVNEKNTKSALIDFSLSPKLVFTSNFPPRQLDDSTSARLTAKKRPKKPKNRLCVS